jgi:hypothetical protein
LDVVTEPVPRDEMRASDADRENVVEQLRHAHGEGRLDLAELDERTQAAYAARTYRDLAKITDDLPTVNAPAPVAAQPSPARTSDGDVGPSKGDRGLRAATGAWLAVSLINLVIWAIVSITSAEWVYPWWIWVAGPWGAILLAGWIGSRVARP